MTQELYRAIRDITFEKLVGEAMSHPSYFMDPVDGHPDLVSFTYGYQDNKLFKTSLSLLFRGLTYDKTNERIVHLPLFKFWGVDEKPETLLGSLSLSRILWVLPKIDGVMLLLTHYQNKPLLRSKKRFLPVEGFIPENIIAFSKRFGDRYTVAIEWVPVNGFDYNLLVPTPGERFVITRVTDNVTGQPLDADAIAAFCDIDGIECAAPLDVDFSTPEALRNSLRHDKATEGYVLVLNNGSGIHTYVKAKTDWYNTMRFATVDDLSHRVVYDAWVNQTLDDLIAFVESNGQSAEHLRRFGDTLTTMFNEFKTVVTVLAEKYKNITNDQIAKLPKTLEVTNALRLMRGSKVDFVTGFTRKLQRDNFDFNALLGAHQK